MMNSLLERYHALFGDTLQQYRHTVLPSAIWITGLRPKEHIIARLKQQRFSLQTLSFSSHSSKGYIATKVPHALGATPLYLLGYYTLQESASQFPVLVLDPQPHDLVIDMCAAPGMKTIQLSTLMQNKGTIIACDVKQERLFALQNNLERCGITNCIVLHSDARKLRLQEKADKILLDAPCSGNFLTDVTWLKKRKPADFRRMAQAQCELLAHGISLLKENGTLVYSTCSLEPEENEEVIDWALKNLHISLEPVHAPIGMPGMTKVFGKNLSPQVAKTWRLMPPQCQGFFVAKLRK